MGTERIFNMKEFKRYTPEQIEQANNADISDYVQSRFQCERAGKEIHIKGYGGLYVNPETNQFFRHSENCWNFVKKYWICLLSKQCVSVLEKQRI